MLSPLKPAWYPSTETSLRVEIDRFVLSGRCDLSIGVADGDRAGKVLVDLKTGSTSLHHRDDLRFYALLDAIRIGTPPRRLATYYLDQGRFQVEDVTEDLLFSTVARVVDGVERMLMLSSGQRTPPPPPGRPAAGVPSVTTVTTARVISPTTRTPRSVPAGDQSRRGGAGMVGWISPP